MKKKIRAKIKELEAKVIEATTPPLGFSIYKLEGWEAQITILKELL